MTTGERTDQYLGFRFHVEIDSLVVAGFSEVSGLSVEIETEEVEEGGVNTYTHQLPKRTSSPNLTLKRGLTDSTALFEWVQAAVAGRIARKNVRVILLDSTGAETWGWEAKNAYPVKWTGPEFSADQASVAVETLELAHEGISGMEGMPSG